MSSQLGALMLLLTAIALFATVSVCQVTLSDVTRVAVIHRHGARYPMPPNNSFAFCGDACGQLSPSGAAMLHSLGRTIQRDYPHIPFTDPSIEPFLGVAYNPRRVVSKSTDVDRTLQSAASFLHGLFSQNDSSVLLPSLPAINGVELSNAKSLLVWTSWPSLVVRSDVTQTAFDVMMAKKLRPLFTDAEYATIGAELGMESFCASNEFQCALAAQDVITCALSNQDLSNVTQRFPFLASHFDKITQVMIEYNAVSMYNASDPFEYSIGTKGFFLATDIVQQLQQPVQPAPVLLHYSGHDITLMPFAETIGNVSLTNPLFGGAFVVELHGTSPNATVRVRYGEPNQAFGSSHEYSFFDLGLKCINSTTGQQYDAPRHAGCPLADWAAYVQTRGPTSPAGICYLPLDVLEAIDCLPQQTRPERMHSNCVYYRQQCPQWACLAPTFVAGSGSSLLDPMSLQCIPALAERSIKPEMSDVLRKLPPLLLMGITAIAVLLVSFLVTAAVLYALHRRRLPLESEDETAASGPHVVDCVVDSVMRSVCCVCCCRERVRKQDEDFFINGTDAGSTPGPTPPRARQSNSPRGKQQSQPQTQAPNDPPTRTAQLTRQAARTKQPKLADVVNSGACLPPQRKLDFAESREPSEVC
jgi:hypothetical protein